MKKVLLVLSLIITGQTGFVYAQKADPSNDLGSAPLSTGRNELKLNLFYTVLGVGELTYERVVGENSGVGASLAVGLDSDSDYKFSILPYYRMYFGKKQAAGFFIEGNAGFLSYRDGFEYSYYLNGEEVISGDNFTNKTSLGIGFATGGKFLNKNGFFGEAFLGVGRLFNSEYAEAYPRIGITLGKRF